MSRVVVVGGGFGGMAVAARLAKTGHEVTLLERSPDLGGALGSVSEEGFTWDAGASYTLLPAVLRPVPATPTTFDRLLLHPAARHLGFTSYGLFCLHVPVLHLLTATTAWEPFQVDFWPLWIATLVVSVVAAELAYRLVERPALRLKGRHPLARRREESAAIASAPSTGTSAR